MTVIDDNTNDKSKINEKNKEGTHPLSEEASKWGYDLYPERRTGSDTTGLKALLSGKGRENLEKVKCERNVYKCIKRSPLVKLMMGALKSAGCEIDIRRHIACEECDPKVGGGYDPILNQVVICQNVITQEGVVQSVLTHEMIHMFDYCRNKLNFRNLEHLACTEIRAANLAHCSFLSAWMQGDTSIFNIKQSHQNCVKNKALSSIMAAREVSRDEAIRAIEKVFDKCYADLEPIGRRIRRNSDDIEKAYAEGVYYGYEYHL